MGGAAHIHLFEIFAAHALVVANRPTLARALDWRSITAFAGIALSARLALRVIAKESRLANTLVATLVRVRVRRALAGRSCASHAELAVGARRAVGSVEKESFLALAVDRQRRSRDGIGLARLRLGVSARTRVVRRTSRASAVVRSSETSVALARRAVGIGHRVVAASDDCTSLATRASTVGWAPFAVRGRAGVRDGVISCARSHNNQNRCVRELLTRKLPIKRIPFGWEKAGGAPGL
jgi:hypothetical protein